jgi:hypothetical protein
MALLFIDSFDHYETADIDKKWTFAGDQSTIVSGGRCGTKALQYETQPSFGGVVKGVSSGSTTAIVGFAINLGEDGQSDTELWSITNGGTPEIAFRYNIDGSFSYSITPTVASPTWTTFTPGDLVRTGAFYYVEFKIVLSASTGSIAMQVNGGSVAVSGVSNINTGTTAWTGVRIGASDFGEDFLIDDLYIADGSGSAPWNDFLGDVHVQYLRPTGAGATTQWDPTGAATNWDAVDDADTPDEDTTYVATSVTNEIDTYVFEDVSYNTGTDIIAVQVSHLARKEDPGDRALQSVTRLSATDSLQGTDLYLTASTNNYSYVHSIFEENPDTSTAWTTSEVDGAEFGMKLTV